jgi:hypothetical protein
MTIDNKGVTDMKWHPRYLILLDIQFIQIRDYWLLISLDEGNNMIAWNVSTGSRVTFFFLLVVIHIALEIGVRSTSELFRFQSF